jgi:hypothetical protein
MWRESVKRTAETVHFLWYSMDLARFTDFDSQLVLSQR